MLKYRVSNFQIFKPNELESNILEVEAKNNVISSQDKQEKKPPRIQIVEPLPYDDTDIGESEEKEIINFRIQRFLSVCELSDEVVLLTQKAFLRPNTIMEEDENQENEDSNLKVASLPKLRQNSFKKSNKFSFFEHGYGLSQLEKANIIADIIRNFDMDKYLKEFQSKDCAIIKLRKKFVKDRTLKAFIKMSFYYFFI